MAECKQFILARFVTLLRGNHGASCTPAMTLVTASVSLIAAANIESTCLVTGPIMTCSRLWIRQRSRGLALVRCLLANVDSAPGSRRNCHGVSCLHVTTWFYIYGSRIIQSTGLLLIRSYTWNSMHGFHTSFSLHWYVSLLLMILVLSAFC